jgi:hypothetical protein
MHTHLLPISSLLAEHYRRLVQVLDYRRIISLLADWSDEMVWNSGYSLDLSFSQMVNLGRLHALGEGQLHKLLLLLLEEMSSIWCNRLIIMVIMVSVEQRLSMFCTLTGFTTPSFVPCIETDNGYGYTRHFCSLHTSLELWLFNNNEREAAEDQDHRNKGLHMAIELSFNKIIQMFIDWLFRFSSHIATG